MSPLLRGSFGSPYTYIARCASTQLLLAPEAQEGAFAITDEQTAGRGRLGRRWHAPAATSILCSLALRPPHPVARWPELSLVAGEACAEAIGGITGVATAIKPPNDVLIGARKLAGILAEACDGRVVLGIGINVNVTADALREQAGTAAISLLAETGLRHDRAALLVAVLEHLERRYSAWRTGLSSP